MKFFTAGDVLEHDIVAPTDPMTITQDASVSDTLSIMLENDFDQLPVVQDGNVAGAVTYKSVARLAKSVPDAHLDDMTIMGALISPTFADRGHDVFKLFETFAVEEFVLVGSRDELDGIITRYDVFYFLRDQFKPFIMIGEIERNLRAIFRKEVPNIETRIQDTFKPRAEDVSGYSVPESLEYFNFEEYKRFISVNNDVLPAELQQDRDFVMKLLESVRQNRNALFHFRTEVSEIDYEIISVAHSYFKSLLDFSTN
jgi:CBS domain-containing protein